MQIINRFISFPCLVFAVIIFCKPVLASSFQKPVVKVNGTVLTEYDIQEALNEIMPAGVFHGGFSSEKRLKKRPEAQEKMIENELLYQEAVRIGITPDIKQINEKVKKTKDKFGSQDKFRNALKKYNMGEKDYIKRLEKKDVIKKYIKTEIEEKAVVSDKIVKKYYNDNTGMFLKPKSIKLWHIHIKVDPSATKEEKKRRKERAIEVHKKIKKGEDRAKLAWEYSDDRYRVKGGDHGYVHKGVLDPDLEKLVFNLEIGKLSGILETRFGYHIAQVDEITPPGQLNLKEAAPNIKKILTRKNEEKFHKTLITRLKKEAKIIVY